jgi:hypothetical protein
MRRLLAVAFVLAFAVPAGASEAAPHVEDPCGDAGSMLWVEDDSVDLPDGRAGGFDIASVRFEDIGDAGEGVRVTLEMCGDVPESRLFGTAWEVNWQLPDTDEPCWGHVHLNDINTQDGIERRARYGKSCMRPYEDVLGRSGSMSYGRFSHVVPVHVDGPRVVWELPAGAFDGEAAAMLEPGTPWTAPRARTSDTGATLFTWYMGTAGGQTGPSDTAGPGRDFVVGG